jgi:hypothetical protein
MAREFRYREVEGPSLSTGDNDFQVSRRWSDLGVRVPSRCRRFRTGRQGDPI